MIFCTYLLIKIDISKYLFIIYLILNNMKNYLCTIKILFLLFFITGCSTDENDRTSSLKLYAVEQISEIELDGAKYKVYNKNNNLIGEYTTDNGVASVSYLPHGEYIVEEVAPPNGFSGNLNKCTVNLTSNYAQEVIFYYSSATGGPNPITSIKLDYFDNKTREKFDEYNCIRIGEYYWIDQNLHHAVPAGNDFENAHPITQGLLDKYMERAFLDKSQYQINNLDHIDNFEKYYGRYYCRFSIDHIMRYSEMHTKNGRKVPGWGVPSTKDFQQLFAMCPFSSDNYTTLTVIDVRFSLGAKEGDNPLAKNIDDGKGGGYKTYWFDPSYVSNMYGFTMMPGGARLNGDGPWTNGLGPNNGYWEGKKGDVYHLFYTCNFTARTDAGEVGIVSLHDRIDTRGLDSYHLYNIRLARKLSDQELGYKLYINTEQTDIKKLGLNDPMPSGYNELPNGYMRGFYVQYILDKENPKYTIQDIIAFAKQVEDSAVR